MLINDNKYKTTSLLGSSDDVRVDFQDIKTFSFQKFCDIESFSKIFPSQGNTFLKSITFPPAGVCVDDRRVSKHKHVRSLTFGRFVFNRLLEGGDVTEGAEKQDDFVLLVPDWSDLHEKPHRHPCDSQRESSFLRRVSY